MSKELILKEKLVAQEPIINYCTKVIQINSSVNPVTFSKSAGCFLFVCFK